MAFVYDSLINLRKDIPSNAFDSQLVIYLPLQTIPECTIDYHIQPLELIDYTPLTQLLLHNLSKIPDVCILVKEHPGMAGARPPKFYKTLNSISSSIYLLDYSLDSHELLELCHCVVTCTGTVAFEAAIRSKPAVVFGDPFYAQSDLFLKIKSLKDLTCINSLLQQHLKYTSYIQSDHDPSSIVRHVLSGCISGEFRHIDYDPSLDESREYLSSLSASFLGSISKIVDHSLS